MSAEWKKPEEEKPECMKHVLGLFPGESYDIVFWDSERDMWWTGDGGMDVCCPLYWTEFPKPPKD